MSSPVHQMIRSTAGATVRTRGRVSAAPAGSLLLGAVPQQAGRPDTEALPVPGPVPPAARTDRTRLSAQPPA
ncbi:hypothetical protein GCM10027073_14030 [Streptomyces chlorus]